MSWGKELWQSNMKVTIREEELTQLSTVSLQVSDSQSWIFLYLYDLDITHVNRGIVILSFSCGLPTSLTSKMRVLRVVGGRKREKQRAADAGWNASVQPMPAEIMRDTANRKLRWWWGPNECCLNSVMLSSLYIDLKREYEDGLEQHLWDALNWQGIREKRWWGSHI